MSTEKSSLSTYAWKTGGYILFIVGVFLMVYTGYILFMKTESQKISEILPEKDIQLVISYPNSSPALSPEKIFFTQLFSPLFSGTENAVLVMYPKDEYVAISAVQENTSPLPNTYCETIQGYSFCAKKEHQTRILSIVDHIKNNASPLSENKEYQSAHERSAQSLPDSAVIFWGKTDFVIDTLSRHSSPLLDAEQKEAIFNALTLLQNYSSSLSGTLHNNEISLFLNKPNPENIFTNTISEYDISEYFIHPSADRYVLLKKPKVLWDILFSGFSAENISTEFITKHTLARSFSTFFIGVSQQGEVSLDFTNDILPLFAGDVLWAENEKGSAILYSLPKKSISSEVYSKFAQTTEKIAQWSLPIKVGHTLKDGTTVYEVFPNQENIQVDEAEDENGGKTLFTNTEANKTLGVVQRDTFLMVSNERDFLNHFWTLSGNTSHSPFHFARIKDKNTFFSFGFNKRKEESSPLSFVELSGTESPEYFHIAGTLTWNPEFFATQDGKNTSNAPENNEGTENITSTEIASIEEENNTEENEDVKISETE